MLKFSRGFFLGLLFFFNVIEFYGAMVVGGDWILIVGVNAILVGILIIIMLLEIRINQISKMMIECGRCKKEFRRNKNTSCGFVNGKDVWWCGDCSNKIVMAALKGKKPKLV